MVFFGEGEPFHWMSFVPLEFLPLIFSKNQFYGGLYVINHTCLKYSLMNFGEWIHPYSYHCKKVTECFYHTQKFSCALLQSTPFPLFLGHLFDPVWLGLRGQALYQAPLVSSPVLIRMIRKRRLVTTLMWKWMILWRPRWIPFCCLLPASRRLLLWTTR